MSKELENKIGKLILDIDKLYEEDIVAELEDIKQSLTPPTAEEVCKALSEWNNYEWEYKESMQRKGFICKTFINGRESYIGYDNYAKGIYMSNHLIVPPHLIEMIGKFYGSIINKQ